MIAEFSENKINIATKELKPNNTIPILDLIVNKGISKSKIPEKSGVYIFWWTGGNEIMEKLDGCTYQVKAKSTHEFEKITIKFTEEWIRKATYEGKICLYVGKTTNLRDRVSKHLKLGSEDIWKDKKRNSGTKPNTVSQMRIGLETVFNKSMFEEIKNDISISWTEMDGYSESINRFFLEDKMISNYYPLFNIDIER
jgi:hypothetical protein